MGVFPATYILVRGNEQHSHSILLITSNRLKSSAGRGDFFFFGKSLMSFQNPVFQSLLVAN